MIQILDVQGKIVVTENIQVENNSQIQVSSLAAGVYNCTVIMDEAPVARFNIIKTN